MFEFEYWSIFYNLRPLSRPLRVPRLRKPKQNNTYNMKTYSFVFKDPNKVSLLYLVLRDSGEFFYTKDKQLVYPTHYMPIRFPKEEE